MDPRVREEMEDTATIVRESSRATGRRRWIRGIVVINGEGVWRRPFRSGGSTYRVLSCDRQIIFLEEGWSCISIFDYSSRREVRWREEVRYVYRCFV